MVTLQIVSDFVCPWCFIGLKRLDVALAQIRSVQPDFQCQVLWCPFFLNPDTPPEGEPYLPFLENKFGGAEKVAQLFAQVREAGRLHDVEFVFEKIALRANTLAAHRLLHWAQARGNARPLVERLFVAQFQRGEHLGDKGLLLKVAMECGYDGIEVTRYLDSPEDETLVKFQERDFRMRGVSMVPSFVVNDRELVVGAEEPTILAAALQRAQG